MTPVPAEIAVPDSRALLIRRVRSPRRVPVVLKVPPRQPFDLTSEGREAHCKGARITLTGFGLPGAYRRRLRTSNLLELLNRELKRRTRVASPYLNEASALRLVSAILAETSDEWEAGRIYLSMETA